MRKNILYLCCFLSTALSAQSYSVGHMSINFKDSTRSGGFAITGAVQMLGSGRDIGAEVYYPATSAGTDVPVAVGQFPVVVFGHGFVMTYDNYDNIYNELAAKGFIVALPRTEGGFSPNHLGFGQDMAWLARQVQSFNTISSPAALSVFNGKVLQKSAIGGHSMGGGCSFIGAENNTNLTCLFNMAAATSNTSGVSSIAGAAMVDVPTLMLSGQRDCVADTAVQNSHYANLASAKKFHVILSDLTHCDFGNGSSVTCTLGQSTSGCSNTISNSLAFSRYMNFLLPFLNNQLKNSCPDGNRFMDSITGSSASMAGKKIQGSIACSNIGIQDLQNEADWKVFPNPVQDELAISTSLNRNELVSFYLSDQMGRVLWMKENCGMQKGQAFEKIDMKAFKSGVYQLSIISQTQKLTKILIKQ
jgi:dienelactone hydrolase